MDKRELVGGLREHLRDLDHKITALESEREGVQQAIRSIGSSGQTTPSGKRQQRRTVNPRSRHNQARYEGQILDL